MIFVLRSERAPSRVLREVDERGVSRTFWLWRHGAWVVVIRLAGGEIVGACSDSLVLRLHTAQGVTVVKVEGRPLVATVPAPREYGRDSAPSVHPLAPALPKLEPASESEADTEPDGREVDLARRAGLSRD